MITDMDKYLFDLQGFILLKGALSKEEVAACNATIDGIPKMEPGGWFGYVHRELVEGSRGIAFQQIYEAGPPFEALIDHPSWVDKVELFVGGQNTFDYRHGGLFIDENFASLRGPGEAIGLHSGGHYSCKKTQYLFRNGNFMCGQINILIALTDIGPGDGATMVIPGSHKANFEHPQFGEAVIGEGASVDGVLGAAEVHMRAGDAILFVDAISHGSARRTNAGERRIVVYRYSSAWNTFRFGYKPSPELLERITPKQRQMIYPWTLLERTPNWKEK